tara:strand:- start:56 stop:433 length:378 start_codon:yes stop_codon:yes gene_type:complete
MQLSNFELHELLWETVETLSPLHHETGAIKISFTGFSYDDIEIEDTEKPNREEFETVYTNKRAFLILRKRRDEKLKGSDAYVAPDYPHATLEKKQEWLDYRQALRDLPPTTEDPTNPVWPPIPTA